MLGFKGESHVCNPPINFHPSWHFLALDSMLHYFSGSSLKLMLVAFWCTFI